MKEVTIVTAFFDLGRGSAKSFNRSNQKYLDYFKFWARIKNEVVIFSDEKTINEALKIRSEYGLLEKTKTVIIDDFLTIDEELFESIDKVVQNPQFVDFHIQTDIPEARNSKYVYAMLLKEWCCKEAVQRNLATGIVAWLDFGFDHGGEYYKNSEDFNFTWKYKFSDKIHLFKLHDFDDELPFEIIRRNDTYIQGSSIIAPDYLWEKLWEMVRTNMLMLNRAGLADDDQLLLLMSYKENPNIFELHDAPIWHSGIQLTCNKNFETNDIKISNSKSLFKNNMFLKKLKYSFRTFINLIKYKSKL